MNTIQVRKGKDRGYFHHGWLESFHTFSFGEYFDRNHMGFHSLRVINEDWIQEGEGFPTHPHKDMEILTYVLDGAVEHKDSMGTHGIIEPGEVQYMSAGSGVFHSEFNPKKNQKTHLLQIWIKPKILGAEPRYDARKFPTRSGSWVLIASPDGNAQSISIRQDARLWAAKLERNQTLSFQPEYEGVWLHLAKGSIQVLDQELQAGDALGAESIKELSLKALEEHTEILLFELK